MRIMKYSFVPKKRITRYLRKYYRDRPHSSFIHLIEDLKKENPELIN